MITSLLRWCDVAGKLENWVHSHNKVYLWFHSCRWPSKHTKLGFSHWKAAEVWWFVSLFLDPTPLHHLYLLLSQNFPFTWANEYLPPLTRKWPFGEIARLMMGPLWLWNVARCWVHVQKKHYVMENMVEEMNLGQTWNQSQADISWCVALCLEKDIR